MMTFSRTLVSAWLVLLCVMSHAAVAAPPDLPAQAMGDDVVGVLWIDAEKMDAAAFSATVTGAMGRFAKPVNETMATYTKLHAPFVRAGGTSLAIVYFDPNSANAASRGVANPVYLFSTGPNANRAAIQSIVEQVTLDEKQKPQARFEMIGPWLMAYDGRLARPYMEKGDAARMETLRTALEPIGQHPAVLAFVPTDRMRRATANRIGIEPTTPRSLLLFLDSLLQCRSLTLAATTGNAPTLTATVRMPDAETGQELLGLRPPLMQTLDEFVKKRDMRGVKIELITQLLTYHAVLSNNLFVANRHLITATLSGPTLTRTAEGIAQGLATAREEALIVRSLNHMKALIVALNSYARDNRGQYPLSLGDLKTHSYVKDLDALMVNPVTGQAPGYVYIRPSLTLNDLAKEKRMDGTPILYESKDGRPNPRGLIGYVSSRVARPE